MISSQQPYALHWFRRDLRLEGNLILQRSLARHQGRVLCIFCFDKKFLSRSDFSWNRFLFFLNTLEHLKNQIESLGGSLVFLDEGPAEAFPRFLKELAKSNLGMPASVTWNRDYEPYALQRDNRLEKIFREDFGLDCETNVDHLMVEPNELIRDDKNSPYYQVFTPFKRKWQQVFLTPTIQARFLEVKSALKKKSHAFTIRYDTKPILESYLKKAIARVSIPIPHVGFEHAIKQASYFIQKKIENYENARDIPSVAGTSQLSIYFKNGTITVPQVIALLPQGADCEKYLSELIWREFYYHILAHFPFVENACFIKKYDDLKWENNLNYFEAWKQGKTGFAIVDAGMRQLNETGWMHNRVRMIVASFLTKDLLINWQWGEKYFMEKLLDGDLAPNNGGWQWAASTGCDPQPYFRIFNPTLQMKRFDPKGEYVKKWVKEYSTDLVPARPLVDHAKQKIKALTLFKTIASRS